MPGLLEMLLLVGHRRALLAPEHGVIRRWHGRGGISGEFLHIDEAEVDRRITRLLQSSQLGLIHEQSVLILEWWRGYDGPDMPDMLRVINQNLLYVWHLPHSRHK